MVEKQAEHRSVLKWLKKIEIKELKFLVGTGWKITSGWMDHYHSPGTSSGFSSSSSAPDSNTSLAYVKSALASLVSENRSWLTVTQQEAESFPTCYTSAVWPNSWTSVLGLPLINCGWNIGFKPQYFCKHHSDTLPGLTVMMVFQLTVAVMPLRKLSKLILTSAMKRTFETETAVKLSSTPELHHASHIHVSAW